MLILAWVSFPFLLIVMERTSGLMVECSITLGNYLGNIKQFVRNSHSIWLEEYFWIDMCINMYKSIIIVFLFFQSCGGFSCFPLLFKLLFGFVKEVINWCSFVDLEFLIFFDTHLIKLFKHTDCFESLFFQSFQKSIVVGTGGHLDYNCNTMKSTFCSTAYNCSWIVL